VEKKTSASSIYDDAVASAGGACGSATPGDMPRSREQIRKLQSMHRKASSPDPVNDLLIYARDQDEDLVMNHSRLPIRYVDPWDTGCSVHYP